MRGHEFVSQVLGPPSLLAAKEVFISVDVETYGGSPRRHGMLSLGACEVGSPGTDFYTVIQPLNENFDPEAMAVLARTGLTMEYAKIHGLLPWDAMFEFRKWITAVSSGRKPVFVALPLGFDWRFVADYFDLFVGPGPAWNPFGKSGLDVRSYFLALTGFGWTQASSNDIRKIFSPRTMHTHHALDDAIEQAEIFEQMLLEARRNNRRRRS